MTHNQNTITHHYQQLQSYERGLIMARQSSGKISRRIARELKRGTIHQIGPTKSRLRPTLWILPKWSMTGGVSLSWLVVKST